MSTTLTSTDIRADILALKKERNAVILAHNYQIAEIQEIADYVGSTRETVTLTLGELKRRGMILFEHRRVVVVEPASLRALV